MNANELFANTPAPLREEILLHFEEDDRDAWKQLLHLLASRRKLRPVFVEKKSKAERREWIDSQLARKANEDLALELLQNWLLHSQSAMLVAFLDELGIAHDGKGLIEDTPSEPAPERVDAAVDALLAKFPASSVSLYLRLFIGMDPSGWTHLRGLLETHPSLVLQSPTP